MAKRGRKPQPTYVTMWTEAVEGVRQVIIERDSKGSPTVWRLYPTGLPKPYFGTIRPGDVESERKAVAKFRQWKATQDGTPWDKGVGEEPLHDSIWVSMFHPRLRDRRTEHLVITYISRYRDLFLEGGKTGIASGAGKSDSRGRKIEGLEKALEQRDQVIGELTIANRVPKKLSGECP